MTLDNQSSWGQAPGLIRRRVGVSSILNTLLCLGLARRSASPSEKKDTLSRKFGLPLGPLPWFSKLGKEREISLSLNKQRLALSSRGLGGDTLSVCSLVVVFLLHGSWARCVC